MRTAAARLFLCSNLCSNRHKASSEEKLESGLRLYKVGSYEFRERQSEAEVNIKKLGGVMDATRKWRRPWIRDCSNNQACTARSIAGSLVEDFVQSARAT